MLQKRRVDLEAVVARVEQKRFHLAGEDMAVGRFTVVQRLDAEGVAPGHQDAGFVVVNQKGEHPAQAVDEGGAVVFVERDKRFDFRAGAERDPARNQLFAQLEVVVHLAVVDGEVAPVVTDEGLRAALQIDDRQTAEGEIRASLAVGAVKVGAAVTNRVRHRGRICLSGPADAVFVIDSDESAHKGKSFPMMGLGLGAYSPVPVTSL